MKPHHLLPVLCLLLTGCGKRYKGMEQEFISCSQQSETLLNDITAHYDACSGQIETVRNDYLRDGAFARLDSLAVRRQQLFEKMITACSLWLRRRLRGHLARKADIDARIAPAEYPAVHLHSHAVRPR